MLRLKSASGFVLTAPANRNGSTIWKLFVDMLLFINRDTSASNAGRLRKVVGRLVGEADGSALGWSLGVCDG